jgi:RND family efflux transporter, MFP subunit
MEEKCMIQIVEKWLKRISFTAGIATLAFLTACSKNAESTSSGKSGGARPPVPVVTATVLQRDIPVQIQSVGTVEPFTLVTVRPQITGIIDKVHFQEGAEVKAGDLLVTLDATPWIAALNQAQANLQRDEARLVNAKLDFLRTSNLFEGRIASEQDFQAAEAAFRAAESTVVADQALVTNALVNLGYTQIRSPIDGRTGLLAVKAGNVVKAPDDRVVTITQIKPAYVSFSVPEPHLAAIRARAAEHELSVAAFPPGETNLTQSGTLTFIDNRVNTNTGTILLRATFPNDKQVLWPGQFVQTVLTLSNLVNATVVPTPAIQNGQAGEFVYVVSQEQTVELRPVKRSVAYDGFTVVLGDVRPGELVVTDGHLRLTPDAKVTVKGSDDAASPTNSVAAQ